MTPTNTKIQKLLKSSSQGDIALGVYLLHKSGELSPGTCLHAAADPPFSISFDDMWVWISSNGVHSHVCAPGKIILIRNIDFRNEKEETNS